MKKHLSFLIVCLLIFTGCVEEIQIVTSTTQDVIVVEGTLTDELKFQEIKLSRSFDFNEENLVTENGAQVTVFDSDNNEYPFVEVSSGTYISTNQFSAIANKEYVLQIKTRSGLEINSSPQQLPEKADIDDLVFERGINENGEEGISVLLSSYDPNNNSNFYRAVYEETYKIIAPNFVPQDLINLGSDMSPNYAFVQRPLSQQICYNTRRSNRIIQANTNNFAEDRLDRFRVHFIRSDNYIISHRYSILVKLFVQNREAYTFFETLNNLSDDQSILSQNQPGTLAGNLTSANSDETVVGFFEVASVDSKRIYFNYEDLFPGELLPSFFTNCNAIINPSEFPLSPGGNAPLADILVANTHRYFFTNETPTEGGRYHLVLRPCGDCTSLGASEIPDFWEE